MLVDTRIVADRPDPNICLRLNLLVAACSAFIFVFIVFLFLYYGLAALFLFCCLFGLVSPGDWFKDGGPASSGLFFLLLDTLLFKQLTLTLATFSYVN